MVCHHQWLSKERQNEISCFSSLFFFKKGSLFGVTWERGSCVRFSTFLLLQAGFYRDTSSWESRVLYVFMIPLSWIVVIHLFYMCVCFCVCFFDVQRGNACVLWVCAICSLACAFLLYIPRGGAWHILSAGSWCFVVVRLVCMYVLYVLNCSGKIHVFHECSQCWDLFARFSCVFALKTRVVFSWLGDGVLLSCTLFFVCMCLSFCVSCGGILSFSFSLFVFLYACHLSYIMKYVYMCVCSTEGVGWCQGCHAGFVVNLHTGIIVYAQCWHVHVRISQVSEGSNTQNNFWVL